MYFIRANFKRRGRLLKKYRWMSYGDFEDFYREPWKNEAYICLYFDRFNKKRR